MTSGRIYSGSTKSRLVRAQLFLQEVVPKACPSAEFTRSLPALCWGLCFGSGRRGGGGGGGRNPREGNQRAAPARDSITSLTFLNLCFVICKMRALWGCLFVNDNLFFHCKILLLCGSDTRTLLYSGLTIQIHGRFQILVQSRIIQGFTDSLIYTSNIDVHYYSI